MAKTDDKGLTDTNSTSVDSFLAKVAVTPVAATSGHGRLIFALDATASREPTWDRACAIQGDMFLETQTLGNLQIQLVYYRGYGEFKPSPWCTDSRQLLPHMTRVSCLAGTTQIAKILQHAIDETKRAPVQAVVFVGDCMEENMEHLAQLAGQLGILNVPVFIFHEGADAVARMAFEHIATLTRGACCPFDSASARQLRDLLAAVAVYAVGGRKALRAYSTDKSMAVRQLTRHLE